MKRLGGPVVITLLSLVLPLVMGALSVPYIIEKLGVAGFGVLTLIWGIFGYFSLFDFGIGKALTKRVAECESGSPQAAVAIRVGLLLLMGLGVISGLLLAIAYPALLRHGILVDSPENFRSIAWLAFGMPFLLVGIGLRGVLEGLGRFSAPAFARIILGIATFGLPVPLLAVWPTLDVIVVGLVGGRVLTIASQGWACRDLLGAALRVRGERAALREIVSFGGWMMVSNLVSPLMVFADRFVIAGSSVASQLAYYTTPFELVTRLLVLPAAATTVLFPKMAGQQGADRHHVAGRMMVRGMGMMFVALLPVVIAGSVFASDFLGWWLNPDFAAQAAGPMALLCWGVLCNSVAQFPFSYLQSMGKVRQIAYLHLLELPVYFMTLPWFLERWGILGAAIAWLLRVVFDLFALSALSAIMLFYGIRQHDD
ncbi:MAG TPA: flippase [Azonexus sp.]|nr:flippase [Azonexus sp.]